MLECNSQIPLRLARRSPATTGAVPRYRESLSLISMRDNILQILLAHGLTPPQNRPVCKSRGPAPSEEVSSYCCSSQGAPVDFTRPVHQKTLLSTPR